MSNFSSIGSGGPAPLPQTPSSEPTKPAAGANGPKPAVPSDSFTGKGTSDRSAFKGGSANRVPTPAPAKVPQKPNLPDVNLGFDAIHFYSVPGFDITITVSSPMPTPEAPGFVIDLNARAPQEPLPDRFILGDGGTTRAFLGVDKTPGSPLAGWLDKIVAKIPQPKDFNATVEFLRKECNKSIKWTAGSSYNDGRAEFDWDKAIVLPANYKEVQSIAGSQVVANPGTDTGSLFPVVPFEKYLEAGKGYCIQKALLAALVLDRVGIPFRIVNGAVSSEPGESTGHTWIELVDGRVLDVAWESIAKKGAAHPTQPDWFRFGGSYRFEDWDYPMLVLE